MIDTAAYVIGYSVIGAAAVGTTIAAAAVAHRAVLATAGVMTQLALLQKRGRKPTGVTLREAWVDSFYYGTWSEIGFHLKKIFKSKK